VKFLVRADRDRLLRVPLSTVALTEDRGAAALAAVR